MSEKWQMNHRKKILICTLSVLLLEIFVFNFRTWQSMFYHEKKLTAEQIKTEGLFETFSSGIFVTEGSGVIYLIGLDQWMGDMKIHNVYLDWELPDAIDSTVRVSGICTLTPFIRDEGHDQYTQLADHVFRKDIEASHYLWLQGAGKIRTIVLKTACSEEGTIHIRKIVINSRKPLEISFVRLPVLLAIGICITSLYSASWDGKKKKQDAKGEILVAVLIGLLLILPAVILTNANGYLRVDNHFRPYRFLAEALAKGQPYLDIEPSEALKSLKNPYDYTARTAAGLEENRDYLWDTAYYKGRYYVYFGIVPCLLFYLPTWLLTGRHISETIVVWSCAGALYFGICFLVRAWCRRYHKRVPFVLQMIATVTIFLGSNMMACLGNPDAHDVPRICGIVFLAWGLFFWISSLPVNEEQEQNGLLLRRMAAGSLLMAMAVGCRPNLALYSFLAPVIFWKYRRSTVEKDIKEISRRYLALILPYVPVAAGLMYYNYVRFGSAADFGFAYNLTVQDCSRTVVSLDKVILGIYGYLLKMPQMSYCFPFLVSGSFAELNYLGHTTVYVTYCFGGLLVCNLVTWCLPALCRRGRTGERGVWTGRILAVIVLLQLLIIALTGGISYNYMADFAFPLLLAGWEGAWILWERLKDGEGLRILRGFLIFGLGWSAVFHTCFYFIGSLSMGNTELYYRLFYAFHFLG